MTDAVSAHPRQHRAVMAADAAPASEILPEPGPVAILPESRPALVDAVTSSGGTVAEPSDATRAVVWTSSRVPHELGALLDRNPRIGWIQFPSAGVDAYRDVMAAHDRPGRVWTSAKGAFAQPVAEHILMLTLALLRLVPKRVRATSWGRPDGRSLYGLTVLIVGAGGIALETIRLLEPFGVRVIVVRRSATPVPSAARTLPAERLGEAIGEADIVVVAAAHTADTEHLIGADELAAMKPSAYLVNIARGPLVDTDALVAALRGGAIAGAGLDVTDPEPLPDGHPLWTMDTCLITPHSADTPEMIEPLIAERIRENMAAFTGDGGFVGRVDPVAGY